MMEAVLTVEMPDGWVKEISCRFNAPIRILDCVPCGGGGGRSLFEMETEEGDLEKVEQEICEAPDVERVELARTSEGKVKGSLVTKKCSVCRTVTECDCYLRSARTVGDGKVQWTVVSASDGALSTMNAKLKEQGCKVEVIKLTRLEEDEIVTPRQEEVLRKAFEMGYFDFPKRVSVRELARRLQISPSTLGEILQRAEKNIIEGYLKGQR